MSQLEAHVVNVPAEGRLREFPEDKVALVSAVLLLLNSKAAVRQALAVARSATIRFPQYGPAWNSLAAVLNEIPDSARAQAKAADLATKLSPDDPTAWHNLSLGLMKLFRFAESLAAATTAVNIPGEENPFLTMHAGFVCSLLGDHKAALTFFDETSRRVGRDHPKRKELLAEVQLGKGIASAKLGNWAAFASAISSRHELATHSGYLADLFRRGRLWSRYRVPHDCVPEALVVLEWGIGDQIQFARLIPQVLHTVHEYFRKTTVACSGPLVEIMASLPGIAAVIDVERLDSQIDPPANVAVIPVLDLIETGMECGMVPLGAWDGPYLTAGDRLPWAPNRRAGKTAVAFQWQGDPNQGQDFSRRIPFREFAEFARLHSDRYTFHSVQTKFAGHNMRPWEHWPEGVEVEDCSDLITDVADLAEIISKCDVFVGQCGGSLHIAGALGKPAVAMLGASHDWRWDFEPIYGCGLVFQERPGDWPSAFLQLDAAIAKQLRRPAEISERMATQQCQ